MALASPMFRKFLRLRHSIQLMEKGAFLDIQEFERHPHQCWFQLDKTDSYLTWSRAALASGSDFDSSLNSVYIPDIIDVLQEQEDREQWDQPSMTILTATHTLTIILPSWRDFEIWYQGLAFLTGVGLSVPTRLSVQQQRSRDAAVLDSASRTSWSITDDTNVKTVQELQRKLSQQQRLIGKLISENRSALSSPGSGAMRSPQRRMRDSMWEPEEDAPPAHGERDLQTQLEELQQLLRLKEESINQLKLVNYNLTTA